MQTCSQLINTLIRLRRDLLVIRSSLDRTKDYEHMALLELEDASDLLTDSIRNIEKAFQYIDWSKEAKK